MKLPRGSQPRRPWHDRWLLDAFRQLNHPAAGQLPPADSAWEALELAGIDAAEILQVASAVSDCAVADLAAATTKLAPLLTHSLALRYGVVPLRVSAAGIEMATANPLAHYLERDLAFATGKKVIVSLAS